MAQKVENFHWEMPGFSFVLQMTVSCSEIKATWVCGDENFTAALNFSSLKGLSVNIHELHRVYFPHQIHFEYFIIQTTKMILHDLLKNTYLFTKVENINCKC